MAVAQHSVPTPARWSRRPSPGQATNFDCDDLVDEGFIDGYDDEDKSGDSPSGDVDLEHVSFNATGSFVSFQADPGWLVAAVNVKGGSQGGNVYVYDGFPGGGVDHDNGLVTADNPPGQPAGISHLVFCLVTSRGAESEPQSEPQSELRESEPEGIVGGGTGTPAASVPNTAMSLGGFAGPLATIVFGLILLGSLGALAYANVTAVRRRS